MSKGIGRLISIGFAKENVRGVAEAAAKFYVPFDDAVADDKDSKATDDQAYGVMESPQGESIVKQWAQFSLKGFIGDKTFPLFLMSCLGVINSAQDPDASNNVFDHTLLVGQTAQHQSLTTFVVDPVSNVDYTHPLTVTEDVEITYEMNKFIGFSAKLRGKKGVAGPVVPSFTPENHFLPQHVNFKLAVNQAGLDAAQPNPIRMLKIKFSNAVEDDDVLGSTQPQDFLNRKFAVEGELEATWQTEAEYKTFTLAGTNKAMRIDLKNTDVIIGTAAHPELKIDLYKVVFGEFTRPVKINDILRQTLKFKGLYSVADTKMITIIMTNLVTSY